MKIIDYIKEHGLQKLADEYKIEVKDYPDRVTLNYDQIESPRFDPICIEARGLILRKSDWSVMARSFDRFWNVGEDPNTKNFPLNDVNVRIEEKIDGSLISVYFDIYNNCWQVSTRKMAFAEGTTVLGNTFRQVFDKAIQNTNVMKCLELADKNTTFIFELVSPETRIVTPYPDYKVYLIGARDNEQEASGIALDKTAKLMNVERPKRYSFNSLEEAIKIAQTLNCMQEGFVLVYEKGESFWRLKCKNEKYLAIAHMRSNGQIAPKRILKLIMNNDYTEYINYFPEDSKYFEFVKEIYEESINRIKNIYESNKNIENQKDFALTIIPLVKYSYEQGVIFGLRKGKELNECLNKIGEKNIAESLNLKDKMRDKFSLTFNEDDVE